jgi:hypothetical protein
MCRLEHSNVRICAVYGNELSHYAPYASLGPSVTCYVVRTLQHGTRGTNYAGGVPWYGTCRGAILAEEQ